MEIKMKYLGVLNLLVDVFNARENMVENREDMEEYQERIRQALEDASKSIPGLKWDMYKEAFSIELENV